MMTDNNDKEQPPLFRTWKGWYWLVVIFLAIEIVLFYFFTNHFS